MARGHTLWIEYYFYRMWYMAVNPELRSQRQENPA